MKTLIFTTRNPNNPKHAELADLLLPNKKEYAARYGYELCVFQCGYDRREHLKGLNALRAVLAEYDRVMLVGADVVFMNHRISLDEFEDFPVTLAREHISWWPINNDVMIWRKTSVSFGLIDRIMRDIDKWIEYPWLWQNHLWNLIQECGWVRDAVNIVEARRLNSCLHPGMGQWQLGDFICHLLSMSNEQKILHARQMLKLAGEPVYYPSKLSHAGNNENAV